MSRITPKKRTWIRTCCHSNRLIWDGFGFVLQGSLSSWLHSKRRAQRSGPRLFSATSERVPRCALLSKRRAQRSGPRLLSVTSERVPRCALLSKRRAQRSGPRLLSVTSERVPRCALLSNRPLNPERVNYARRQRYWLAPRVSPHPLWPSGWPRWRSASRRRVENDP